MIGGCTGSRRKIQSCTASSYDTYNNCRYKSSVDYYQNKTNLEFYKTLNYNVDSSVISLDLNYRNFDESRSFYLSWQKDFVKNYPPINDTVNGIPKNVRSRYPDPYYLNKTHIDTIETLYFNHYNGKNDKNEYIYLSYETEPFEAYAEVSYESDTLEYDRELELSVEVIEYYKNLVSVYADSIELTSFPVMPNLDNCTKLLHSSYRKIECLSEVEGYFKETQIDSTLGENGYEIKETEIFYTYIKTVDENGGLIIKRSNKYQSIENHYQPSDLINPYYSLSYSFNSSKNDTLYEIEMATTFRKGVKQTKYSIIDNLSQKKSEKDLRLPIISREINYWQNKKGELIRIQYIGFTEDGHQLEADKAYNKGEWILLVDNRTIPEISGNQVYDLSFDWVYHPQPYNKTKKRLFKKKPSHFLVPNYSGYRKSHNKNLTKIEHNRNTNYRKWISTDSSIVYELNYYR